MAENTQLVAAQSHVGKIRANNQDSGYAGTNLVVVADGMGGHAGGDVASAIATKRIAQTDQHYPNAHDAAVALQSAFLAANALLEETVADHPELAGMGTTASALVRSGDEVVVAHIGDSRIYLFRDGSLTQMTTDHTFVQRLVDAGRITEDEARVHPRRSVLMRVLGNVDAAPEIDVHNFDTRRGDRWLLCSDGLSGFVSHDEIQAIFLRRDGAELTTRRLIQRSLDHGAPDNVTVIVVDIDDSENQEVDPVFVGSANNALILGADASTRSSRRPALLRRGHVRHSHFESRSQDFLDELIEEDERRAKRRKTWLLITIGLIVVLVVVGIVLTWQWAQPRYELGADGHKVTNVNEPRRLASEPGGARVD